MNPLDPIERDKYGVPIKKKDKYGVPIKKKDEIQDGVSELEDTSLELQETDLPVSEPSVGFKVEDVAEGPSPQRIDLAPIEDLVTSLEEKSQLTDEQKQYVEGQVIEGLEGKPVSATFERTGVMLTPPQTEYEKQKPQLAKEFSKIIGVPEKELTDEELTGYFSNKKRKELYEIIQQENREDYIQDLTSSDKDQLEKYKKKLGVDLPDIIITNNILGDLIMSRVESGYYTDGVEASVMISKAYEAYDKAASSAEKLAPVEKELDLLKRKYGTIENIVGRLTASTLEILSGANKFARDIEPLISPISYGAKMALGVQDFYDEAAQNMEDVLEKLPEDIMESLRRTKSVSEINSVGDFAQWTTDVISETVTQLLTVAATGGAGGISILAASAYGNKLNQLEKEEKIAGRELYGPFQKRVASTLIGGAVFASEWVTKGILKKGGRVIQSALKGGLRGELRGQIKKSLTDKIVSASKGLWTESDKEAWSEVGEQLVENIIDKYLLGKDVNLSDGLVDVYSVGKLMGLLMHALPQIGAEIIQPMVSQDTRDQIGNNIGEIIELSKNYGELPEATKVIIEEQVAELDAKTNKIVDDIIKATKNLPKEKAAEVLDMDEELKTLLAKAETIKNDPVLNEEQKKVTLQSLDQQYSDLSKQKNQIVDNSLHEVNKKAQEKEGQEKFDEALTEEKAPISKEGEVKEKAKVKEEIKEKKEPKPKQITKKPKQDGTLQLKQKDGRDEKEITRDVKIKKDDDQQKRREVEDQHSFERRYKDEILVADKEGIKGKNWSYREGEFFDNSRKKIGTPSPETLNEFQKEIIKLAEAKPVPISLKEAKKIDISESIGLNKFISYLDDFDKDLGKFGKETLGVGIPVIVARGSIQSMKLASETIKITADVISEGINHMIDTDWYRSLSDKDKKHFVDNFEEELQKARDVAIKQAEKEQKETPKPSEKEVVKQKEAPKEDPLAQSLEEVQERISKSDRKAFEIKEATKFERVFQRQREKWQDHLYGVRKIQEKIEKQRGYKQEKIESDFNKAQKLMFGAAKNELELLDKKVEKIAKDIGKSEFDIHKVDQFMKAKHAEERNIYIKENVDPENDSGSGMTTEKANEILNSYNKQQTRKLEELSKPLYDLIQETLDIVENRGLMTKEEVEAIRKRHKYYVPLQGFAIDEKDGSEVIFTGMESSKGLSVKGREFKKAKGRKSEAGDVTAQIIAQHSNAVIRGHKNDVLKTLETLVKQNPNKDVWNTFSAASLLYKLPPGVERDSEKGRKIFSDRIEKLSQDESVVKLKIDGKTHYIEFEDKHFGLAINDASIVKAALLAKTVGVVNNWLRMTYTVLNPDWIPSNFFRDIETAIYSSFAESDISYNTLKDKNVIGKAIKGTTKSMREIYRYEQGKTPSNKEVAKYYREFSADGSKASWFYNKPPEQIAEDIQNIIALQDPKSKKAALRRGFKAIKDLVENTNLAVENGIRLSTYIELRKADVERSDAALFAKEMTVNFNLSGEYGQVANAAYLFFSTAMNSSARFGRAMTKLKRNIDEDGNVSYGLNKAQKLAGGVAVLSGLITYLNISMSEDDPEDGVSYYSKIPQYVKERNMIFMNPFNGRTHFTLPLPYGYSIFNNAGMVATEISMGEKTVGEGMMFLASSFLNSFSPLPMGAAGTVERSLLKSALPTVAKPIYELSVNENYYGGIIYGENFPIGAQKASAELGRRTTPEAFKNMAKLFNEMSGGSKYDSGGLDFHPDKMRYLLDFAFGGTGKFVVNSADLMDKIVKRAQGIPVPVEAKNIPFLRKVYGEPVRYADQAKFYERRQEIINLKKEKDESDDKNNKKFRGVADLNLLQKETIAYLKGIRDDQDDAKEIEDPTQRAAKLNKLDRKYYKKIAKFNKAYNKKRGK